MKKNHMGVWVDSEKAIPGVVPVSEPAKLAEEQAEGIDLAYEQHLGACENEDHEHCAPEMGSGVTLIGSWIKGEDGKYSPDTGGDYSAIICGEYVQVMRSKYTERVALCSPCFPGQGDLTSDGDFLAYTLPPEIWNSDDE